MWEIEPNGIVFSKYPLKYNERYFEIISSLAYVSFSEVVLHLQNCTKCYT